ncbi:MAG: alpha/beta hydrolase [Candidatus Rokubacteria bacterium]|nr:alpha/beta hydrolase [Candidatus Rokubacteria bacterium]
MKEPWSHRFVEANGLRFHCVTAGEGPVVLLLHGFPEFWYSWRHQIPALAAAGFTVVAPDLRGYNDSDKPEGIEAYRISEIVEDVAGLIRAFGQEGALVVGHDWGGAAAYAFAMLHPEMTRALAVLNCPHPAAFGPALFGGKNLDQMKRSWYMFFFQLPGLPEQLLAANNFRLLKLFAYATARRGTFTPGDLKAYTEAFAKPGALTAAINWYRAMFRRPQPAVREFPKIGAPTLIIWGERDHFLGKELTRGMTQHFSGKFSIRSLPGVSHWVQQEAPARVNGLLLEFFKEFKKRET